MVEIIVTVLVEVGSSSGTRLDELERLVGMTAVELVPGGVGSESGGSVDVCTIVDIIVTVVVDVGSSSSSRLELGDVDAVAGAGSDAESAGSVIVCKMVEISVTVIVEVGSSEMGLGVEVVDVCESVRVAVDSASWFAGNVDVCMIVEIAVTVVVVGGISCADVEAEAGIGVQVQVQTGVDVGARVDVEVVGIKGDEDAQVTVLELDPRPGQKIVSLVGCAGFAPSVTMTMTGVVRVAFVLLLGEALMSPSIVVLPSGVIAVLLAGELFIWACAWADGVSSEVMVSPSTVG
ncbi:hypothetical protein BDW68DRAFT_79734 [Aspergillus falconensis]